ncbi:MAG TPA: hypothetical protein VKF79_00850, partial [Candidatus Acidoferrum sp.]|nr:hypothetical protein [Candidatus Acidoferrum sp.]
MNDEDLIELDRLAETNPEPRPVSAQAGGGGETVVPRPMQLSDDARARAAEWKLAGKVTRSQVLQQRLEQATAVILETGQKLALEHQRSGARDEDQRSFVNNLRLLRAASLEVRAGLKFEIPIQQLSSASEPKTELLRPYVAAQAYLSAANYLFAETAFAEYMQAFQESGDFEMHEIWALKPMMQLVALECVAAKVKSFGIAGEETPGANAVPEFASAIPFSSLIKSFHRLSHTTLKDSFIQLSRTDAILMQDPIGAYACMDFESCDLYRAAIQELMRFSAVGEFEIARLAVEFSRQALQQQHPNERARERRGHVGFYLLGRGRRLMKQQIRYQARGAKAFTETFREAPDVFYF